MTQDNDKKKNSISGDKRKMGITCRAFCYCRSARWTGKRNGERGAVDVRKKRNRRAGNTKGRVGRSLCL
jgi:hypothetical protein